MGIGGAIAGQIAGDLAGTGLQMAWQQKQAREQREWQKEMSSSAHQREVADLRAAGLNPILSAGGKGATVGQGSTAGSPDMSHLGSNTVASAVAVKRAIADTKSVETEQKRKDVNLQLEKDMLKWYRNKPEIREGANAAMLAKKVGVSPTVIGLYGTATSKGLLNEHRRRMTAIKKQREITFKKGGNVQPLKKGGKDAKTKNEKKSK